MKKETFLAINISALILVSSLLVGMFFFTDIYDEVREGIVIPLCLSCIKLDYANMPSNFTFDTANGQEHPDFVINHLKTDGLVLIEYGEKSCRACEEMINYLIKPYFNLTFDETKSFETKINLNNFSFVYVYIYIDDPDTPQETIDSYDIYNNDHSKPYPMFTIITIEEYHDDYVRPYYITLYGKLGLNNDYERMYEIFVDYLTKSNELYTRNIEGFK